MSDTPTPSSNSNLNPNTSTNPNSDIHYQFVKLTLQGPDPEENARLLAGYIRVEIALATHKQRLGQKEDSEREDYYNKEAEISRRYAFVSIACVAGLWIYFVASK